MRDDSSAHGFVIAVCTFKRPVGLANLLDALADQEYGRDLQKITVLVVDNDPERSARPVVADASERNSFHYEYLPAMPKGLVAARNAALDYAKSVQAVLLFLDDDEIPSSGWFVGMREMHVRFPLAIVAGPVCPVFEAPTPAWSPRGDYWNKASFADGELVFVSLPDANVLYPLKLIQGSLRYDMKFNTSGAQDTLLLRAWLRSGEKIVWASAAKAFESVPVGRMSLTYARERNYFGALSYVWVERAEGRSRLRPVLRVFEKIILGSMKYAVGSIRRDAAQKALGSLDFSTGSGTLAGLRLTEYDRYADYQIDTESSSGKK